MPRRDDLIFAQTTGIVQFNGAGTQYIVQKPNGDVYIIYVDTGSDVAFRKSTDFGVSWSNPTVVFAGTVTGLAVWYDRWSDIAAGLIHLAYTESGTHDTLYRTINTESSDALSTQTVIFAGASAVITGSNLSITRSRGGNVYCKTQIDAGAEGGFFKLLNANVPNGAWAAALTNTEALATLDMQILVPGFASDNNDIMCIFWDASANEISRYVYDDSANTWAETTISGTTMVEISPATAFPNFAVTVDLTNSQIILIAWNGIDTANQDLKCWTVSETAITAKTDVVLNGTDDQGLAAIGIDLQTGYWHAFYAGASNGSETWTTSLNIYTKVSQDGGTTWGAETKLTNENRNIAWLITCPRLYLGHPIIAFHNNIALDELRVNVNTSHATARFQLGM